jgi:hypothetical protein
MLSLSAMINERNRKFWQAESAQAERRIADPDIFSRATADMHAEVYYQKSFEQALQDAEGLLEDSALQKWTHRRLPRLGGSSKKTDALQEVILDAVRKCPGITE